MNRVSAPLPQPESRNREAQALLDAMPVSVQLPAGTGKTHLLVAVVAELAARATEAGRGSKAVLLTHTNAGVKVIRRRLRDADLTSAAHVATITSFALEFARAYPQLAGLEIPQHPDWSQASSYLSAGLQVCRNRHVQEVLTASYSHMLVDEYQDCTELQHDLVRELHRAIPLAAVFGDPLQAIFGFDPGMPLVPWDTVQEDFPDHPVDCIPWRWRSHNRALGDWLLRLRPSIRPGVSLDLSNRSTPDGVSFVEHRPDLVPLRNRLYALAADPGTVLVLAGHTRDQTRTTAGRLGIAGYAAMEDVNGTFMREQLSTLAQLPASGRASWLGQLAKLCFSGFAKLRLDNTVFKRLDNGLATSALKRPGLGETLTALDQLNRTPQLANLAAAMHRVARAGEAKLHSPEAWHDIAAAAAAAAGRLTADPPAAADLQEVLQGELGAVRDQRRHSDPRERLRQVSRTVLVKGLEFDHVIIANLAEISDAHNLYVALTRARRSITILGAAPSVTLTATKGAPSPRSGVLRQR